MQTSRRLSLGLIGALVLAALLLPLGSHSRGQGGQLDESTVWGPSESLGWKNLSPEQQQRMLRFSTFVNEKVPEAYLKAENGVGYTTTAIAAGGPIYASHCAKCHGATGLGNGALAHALSPSPALLAYMIQQPIAIDQYLLWSISEGGKPFGTAMPAFKTELTQNEIWQVVAYLRAGFPGVDDEGAPKASGAAPPATTDEPSPAPKP
jgi:mono/diheme cytochrome c family protein